MLTWSSPFKHSFSCIYHSSQLTTSAFSHHLFQLSRHPSVIPASPAHAVRTRNALRRAAAPPAPACRTTRELRLPAGQNVCLTQTVETTRRASDRSVWIHAEGECGQNARCTARNHRPVCRCNSGYTGDPFRYCSPIPKSE